MWGIFSISAILIASLASFVTGWLLGRGYSRKRSEQMHRRELEHAEEGYRKEMDRLIQESRNFKDSSFSLQECHRRSEEIFRHLSQGVVVLDLQLRVLSSNPAARRLLHCTSVQIAKASIDEMQWSGGKQDASDSVSSRPWWQCLQSEAPVDPVQLAILNQGGHQWLEVACFPAYDSAGRIEKVIVVLSDVSKIVASDLEIRQLKSETSFPGGRSTLSQPESSPPIAPVARRSTPDTDHPHGEGSSTRVLLVEDNAVNQAVAMGILRKLGLEIEVACDGEQALKQLERNLFHLVFMDCQMPVLDGYEATRRIRDPLSTVMDHSVPVIAVTANALKGDREKCLECGMDDYLPKPVTRDAFEQVLAKWIPGWVAAPISSFPLEAEESSHPTSSKPQREIFDLDALVRRLLGQEELVGALLEMFFQDGPAQMKRLEQAIESASWPEALKIAHGLKGTLANLEARSAAQAASVLEHACRAPETALIKDAFADLEEEARKAQEAMHLVSDRP